MAREIHSTQAVSGAATADLLPRQKKTTNDDQGGAYIYSSQHYLTGQSGMAGLQQRRSPTRAHCETRCTTSPAACAPLSLVATSAWAMIPFKQSFLSTTGMR